MNANWLCIPALIAALAAVGCAGPRNAASPTPTAATRLSPHRQWVRNTPFLMPPAPLRLSVRPSDKRWLIREFRRGSLDSEKNLAVTWFLAYIGDDQVFEAFSSVLRRAGPAPMWEPGKALAGSTVILHALGFMARSNELALAFLKQAISPGWWRGERRWRVATDDAGVDRSRDVDRTLAALGIVALGLSGRTEAEAVINMLRTEEPPFVFPGTSDTTRDCSDAIYGAKRLLAVAKALGPADMRAKLYTPDFEHACAEWERTDECRQWREWAFPRAQHPRLWRKWDAQRGDEDTPR